MSEHRMYVGNFPISFTENDLMNIFRDCEGVALDRFIIKEHKAFAFISCDEHQKAVDIVEEFNGIRVSSRKLIVRLAEERRPKQEQESYESTEQAYKPSKHDDFIANEDMSFGKRDKFDHRQKSTTSSHDNLYENGNHKNVSAVCGRKEFNYRETSKPFSHINLQRKHDYNEIASSALCENDEFDHRQTSIPSGQDSSHQSNYGKAFAVCDRNEFDHRKIPSPSRQDSLHQSSYGTASSIHERSEFDHREMSKPSIHSKLQKNKYNLLQKNNYNGNASAICERDEFDNRQSSEPSSIDNFSRKQNWGNVSALCERSEFDHKSSNSFESQSVPQYSENDYNEYDLESDTYCDPTYAPHLESYSEFGDNEYSFLSVANFPFGTTEGEIYDLFSDYDPRKVFMICNYPHPENVTEAIVCFTNEDDAHDAIFNLDNILYRRRTLLVTDANDSDLVPDLLSYLYRR